MKSACVPGIAVESFDSNLNFQYELVKQRIATGNKGKRGGTRAIIAYRVKDKFFFLHGFAKNEKSTTDPKEDRVLKELGTHFLSLTNTQIQIAIDNFELYEVTR